MAFGLSTPQDDRVECGAGAPPANARKGAWPPSPQLCHFERRDGCPLRVQSRNRKSTKHSMIARLAVRPWWKSGALAPRQRLL